MRRLRYWVPVLGTLALILLFLKMPEAPDVWGLFKCKTCGVSDPYLPMVGSGYFALLITVALLFPNFPSPSIARGGLIWALLLAPSLTYIDWPAWCIACLIGHICNISIWTIWWLAPPIPHESRASPLGERLFLTLFAPISMITLFSCLNLTLMVYHLKTKQTVLTTSLQVGDKIPHFTSQNQEYRALTNATTERFINFVSPNCPYCKEQLLILDEIAAQLANSAYSFIHISPLLTPDLIQQSTAIEWIEDKEGQLRELFKVSGYPTLFVVGSDNKIRQVISGVPLDLKTSLLTIGVRDL